MTPLPDLLRTLRVLRRRWMVQVFARSLARCLLVAAALVVILALVQVVRGKVLLNGTTTGMAALAATFAALVLCAREWPGLPRMAAMIDRMGDTRDRFVTAMALAERESDHGMLTGLAVRECDAYLRSRDFRPLLRWRIPRELPWLAVPLLAIGLLQWRFETRMAGRRAEQAAAQAAVAGTVKQLQELSNEVRMAAERNRADELNRAADQIQRGAEQLRADATRREEAEKAALRELSALEDLVKQMRDAPRQLTEEERAALAKALAQNEATKAAAEALAKGDMDRAAKALEEAANVSAAKDPAEAARAEQALKQALDRLAQQRALSAALRSLARKAGQPGAQQGASSSLLRQLAQALRQTGLSNPANQRESGRNPATQQTLEQLLAAIQNMKQGGLAENRPGPTGRPGQHGDGKEQVLVQSFADGQQNPAAKLLGADLPSGRPGSEHDTGTSDSPLGPKNDPASEKSGEMVLKGQLGEGESLSQFLPSASDGSRASRRYKELYQAMAPAAQDAVLQENIPLGSRVFVRRYFEAIRPKE